MAKPIFQTSKKERAGYYSYFLGQNILYIFITMFISVYFTSELGIPPAMVGTIILVARIWDAVNDPMLAIFIEKANLKSGKFKPWIKSVAIAIPILTVLVFSFTDVMIGMSLALRVGIATVIYILWGMTYTISDAPAFALATVMTTDMDERNSIISFSRLFALIGIMIAMVGGPIITDAVDGNWTITALILAVIAFVFLLGVNWTKERIESTQHSPTLKQILSAIFQNKYLVYIVVTIVLMNGFNFGLSLTPFLAQHVFGDLSLASAISAISILPMVIAAPLLPALIRKFGKNNLMKFSLVVIIVFSLVTYFVARNSFGLFLGLYLLKMTLSSSVLIIGALYFADTIEYDYYKKGTRFEAAVFSAQTFSNKAISAISGAGGLYLISLFGFEESIASETVVQTAGAIDGIWTTFNLGPMFGAVLALFFFVWKYDLDEKKLKQMGIDSGRLQVEETVE